MFVVFTEVLKGRGFDKKMLEDVIEGTKKTLNTTQVLNIIQKVP